MQEEQRKRTRKSRTYASADLAEVWDPWRCLDVASAKINRKMFALPLRVMLACAIAFACAFAQETASEWTRFRGPDGAGSLEDSPAPIEMSSEAGFVWKRAIPTGKSSPILTGDRVIVTARDGERLLTVALSRRTGETLWTRKIIRTHVDRRNALNEGATDTPVTDGKSVYVFFADFGLAAYSVQGEELWRRKLGPFRSLCNPEPETAKTLPGHAAAGQRS